MKENSSGKLQYGFKALNRSHITEQHTRLGCFAKHMRLSKNIGDAKFSGSQRG
jgi:hypothetical protein